jgi:hypothetical protein
MKEMSCSCCDGRRRKTNCNFNFDFGPWAFFSFHHFLSYCWNVNLSNVAFATSLNSCHITFFFCWHIKWETKPMGLNFTGAKWVDFFWQGPKPKFANFTETKSTFYP